MGKWYKPIPNARGFRQRGIASWYGKKFHGRKTANGERYNMYGISAAHKTLPLGTYVEVRNINNNKKLQVRINDRGPFVRGRIIDLSYGAAKKIGIVGVGTAPVEIIALGAPSAGEKEGIEIKSYSPVDYYSGNFTIQIGAFSDLINAKKLKIKLAKTYKNAHITSDFNGSESLHRVRVGKCSTLEKALEYEAILIQHGYKDAFAVAE